MTTARAGTAAEAFARIAARLEGRPLAILLDVDGTLAPIAPRPEEARVPEETRVVLERLVAVPDVTVGIVSGRAAADSLRLVGLQGIWALGNHGMEVLSPEGDLEPHPEAAKHAEAVQRAAQALGRVAEEITGALVENKRWTLSLHYRLVEDERDTQRLLDAARALGAELGLRATEGKKVLELRPPVAVDKGTAAVALAERVGALHGEGAVFFAGDDRTDEDAIRSLRARTPRAMTVHVGEGAETAAELVVKTPADLRALLAMIAGRLEAERPAGGRPGRTS